MGQIAPLNEFRLVLLCHKPNLFFHENSFGLNPFRFNNAAPPSLVCVKTNHPAFSAYLPTSSFTTSAPIPASILVLCDG